MDTVIEMAAHDKTALAVARLHWGVNLDEATEIRNTYGRQDRALGAFIGLAIGDSMGAPVEFKPRGTFEPVTEFRLRTHNQNRTVAARAIADMKTFGHLS